MNRIGTNDHLILFKNDGTDCGAITIAGTNTTNFNTTSDYRLKEDLKDFNGLALVSKIPVYDFQWKRDSTRSYGVMAHELQSVLPYAVSGTKDGENTQGVDYSKIVPLLVKAIQEQQVQLGQLKAEQTTTSSLLRQLQLDLQSIQKPNTVHKE
jgi:Cu/Ag efflux pump CusA